MKTRYLALCAFFSVVKSDKWITSLIALTVKKDNNQVMGKYTRLESEGSVSYFHITLTQILSLSARLLRRIVPSHGCLAPEA